MLVLLRVEVRGPESEELRSVTQALRAYATDNNKTNKTPGHQGSGQLPWLVTLRTCCDTSLLRELGAPSRDSTERGHLEAEPGFSRTLPHGPFHCAGFSCVCFCCNKSQP